MASDSCDSQLTTTVKLKRLCLTLSELLDDAFADDKLVDLSTRQLILHKLSALCRHPWFDRALCATTVSTASASPRRGRAANDSDEMRADDCVDKVKGTATLRRQLATGSQKKTAAMCHSSALPPTTAMPIATRSDTQAKAEAMATGSRPRAQSRKRSQRAAVSSDCSALATATGLAAPSPSAKKRLKTAKLPKRSLRPVASERKCLIVSETMYDSECEFRELVAATDICVHKSGPNAVFEIFPKFTSRVFRLVITPKNICDFNFHFRNTVDTVIETIKNAFVKNAVSGKNCGDAWIESFQLVERSGDSVNTETTFENCSAVQIVVSQKDSSQSYTSYTLQLEEYFESEAKKETGNLKMRIWQLEAEMRRSRAFSADVFAALSHDAADAKYLFQQCLGRELDRGEEKVIARAHFNATHGLTEKRRGEVIGKTLTKYYIRERTKEVAFQ